jgi:hypothetical protein
MKFSVLRSLFNCYHPYPIPRTTFHDMKLPAHHISDSGYRRLIHAGLCRRRRWPDPLYESYNYTSGYTCVVRVNNREYQTDTIYETETLTQENAAMRAYLICRNFSVNDGMYPCQCMAQIPWRRTLEAH